MHSDHVSPLSIGITVGIPEKERADVGIGVSVGGNGEDVGNEVAVNGNVTVELGVSCSSSASGKPLQEDNITTIRNNENMNLLSFIFYALCFVSKRPTMA